METGRIENKQGELMKGMQQTVRFFPPAGCLPRLSMRTPRVTVNISLAYFPISAIIRRDVDECTVIVQADGKFRFEIKSGISWPRKQGPNHSKTKTNGK